jgi:hypothetical protein
MTLIELFDALRDFARTHYAEDPIELRLLTGSGQKIRLSIPIAMADKNAPNGHSEDFRSCRWQGVRYSFSPKQSLVVAKLWESYEDGIPDVSQAVLLEAAESDGNRLRSLFTNGADKHPAWGSMIVAGSGKGTYRLSLDI